MPEIVRTFQLSRNTVAKYADMENISLSAPLSKKRAGPEFEGNKGKIKGARETDRKVTTIGKGRLLVIDGIKLLPLDANGARLFF